MSFFSGNIFIIIHLLIYLILISFIMAPAISGVQNACMNEINQVFESAEFRLYDRHDYARNAILYLRIPDNETLHLEDHSIVFYEEAREYYNLIFNYLNADYRMPTPSLYCSNLGSNNRAICLEELKSYFSDTNDTTAIVRWTYKNITINDIPKEKKHAKHYMFYNIARKFNVDAVIDDQSLMTPLQFCKQKYPSKYKSKKTKIYVAKSSFT